MQDWSFSRWLRLLCISSHVQFPLTFLPFSPHLRNFYSSNQRQKLLACHLRSSLLILTIISLTLAGIPPLPLVAFKASSLSPTFVPFLILSFPQYYLLWISLTSSFTGNASGSSAFSNSSISLSFDLFAIASHSKVSWVPPFALLSFLFLSTVLRLSLFLILVH